MVQTLADSVRRTRLRDAFTLDSMAALNDMKTSGSGYELGQVRAYFSDLMAGELLDFTLDALQVLTHQSGIGRPVEGGLRELIISWRRSAYLARYEFDETRDLVLVARIRHQRESGYWQDEL